MMVVVGGVLETVAQSGRAFLGIVKRRQALGYIIFYTVQQPKAGCQCLCWLYKWM